MKAYKGFNKDMTCRGFQFEEGKTYEEPEAKLCEKGFHACLNPIETFYFYSPSESIYREVEIEDDLQYGSTSSKVCGKKITIKEKLSTLDICLAHFEYVRKQTLHERLSGPTTSLSDIAYSSLCADGDSSLAAQGHSSLCADSNSSLAAQRGSSLMAINRASLAAQKDSSLMAQDYSSLAAQDHSSLAASDCSSLAATNRSSLAASDCSSLVAQDFSYLEAGDYSSLAAQTGSSLMAINHASLAAQTGSSLMAQDYSSLAAHDDSSLVAGKDCALVAFNSKAKAGLGSVIVLANRDFKDGKQVITDFCAGVVDGVNLMPDVWYKVENGKFVEC